MCGGAFRLPASKPVPISQAPSGREIVADTAQRLSAKASFLELAVSAGALR
jgi:hypothetical protein